VGKIIKEGLIPLVDSSLMNLCLNEREFSFEGMKPPQKTTEGEVDK